MKGLTAAIARNPAPTFQDPQGFAIGVLAVKDLKDRDVELVQWRFRYLPNITREHPFEPHVEADGQFCTSEGETGSGFSPGDHQGCLCQLDPVFRQVSSPDEVSDEVDEGGD